MPLSESGEPCLKRIMVKVFAPGNKKYRRVIIRANAGKAIPPSGVESTLKQMADAVEKTYPGQEYHLVPVGVGAFNFVHLGETLRSDS